MVIKVEDVMGGVAVAVRPDTPFSGIIDAMRRFEVSAVAVLDADGRPVGIVSEDDLLLKETDTVRHGVPLFESGRRRREHRKAAGVTAAELMTSPVITVTPATPAREAARLMHERRIKQLPVVDPGTGRITGTVHQHDLLRVFARPPDELHAEIEEVVREQAGRDAGSLSIVVRDGAVTIGGTVGHRSQITYLVEALRAVEGVVAVTSEMTFIRDDVVAPPFY
ncbi:CBS domain-containing protein [Planobispora siamensis]|uniref:CBS domain-containing protein n=1 Tax=Planobispora siamensis TaxID=936338 RepID=A0A8J3SQ35_9ACTN|nr:CBS domain-containing protein [Planobispora siamensis]GIH96324.1 hypothetical protein Psi01_69540 [Planobispora siamensis]